MKMAREAGIPYCDELQHFADLAAAKERVSRKAAQIENELLKEALAGAAMKERRAVWAEREACAQVCGGLVPPNEWYDFQRAAGQTARECGKAIRARGKGSEAEIPVSENPMPEIRPWGKA